jgi:hypothetical protein
MTIYSSANVIDIHQNQFYWNRKPQTLIAVVYATTSGSTPAIRMLFKICTEKRSIRELIFLQVQQSRKKRSEREREINQWPGKAEDLLEKESGPRNYEKALRKKRKSSLLQLFRFKECM